MKNKRQHKFYSQSSAVKRELEAIEEHNKEISYKVEGDVVESFNSRVFCSLKKILIKITKAP